MVIAQPGGLRRELVDVGCFNDRVSSATEVAVALVIRDDENDVVWRRGEDPCCEKIEEKCSFHESLGWFGW